MNNQAIYIHVPWCRRRCPYCDFYVVIGKPERAFVSAIIKEFEKRAPEYLSKPASSLYFGGGTPSMMKPSELHEIINYFFNNQALIKDAEITLEANPEDINLNTAKALASTPINRISLGIQSFDDTILKALGRMHNQAQALASIEYLQDAGFSNISVDLIIGVNHENEKQILNSLLMLKEKNIPHISTYLLTIEEQTNFYRRIKKGQMTAPLEEDQVRIYRLVQQELKNLGYEQYDISSYARLGFFSRHNQVYWAQGTYLGLGSGAHSMKLTDGAIERAHNKTLLNEWLKKPEDGFFVSERLEPEKAFLESLAFGLRNMYQGVDPNEQSLRHGCKIPASLAPVVEKLKNYEWLSENNERYYITPTGALFADAIMAEILSVD